MEITGEVLFTLDKFSKTRISIQLEVFIG